jgi:hypothetical protein
MERRPPIGNSCQRDPAQRRDDYSPDGNRAQQWGELALVSFVGVEGMWTIGVLSTGSESSAAASAQ